MAASAEIEVAAGAAGAAWAATAGAALERLAEAEGLLVRTRSSPKAYPGAVHWHFGRPGEAGTLEATLWPAGRRLWLKVHPRRAAAWVRPTALRLREALERELAGGASRPA